MTTILYAVRITSKDGRTFLPYGSHSLPWTAHRFADAKTYREELKGHLSDVKMKIVRVRVKVEELTK